MSSIKVSVIIVSYIKIDIVDKCLSELYKFNDIGSELEVIVVDNSPDEIRIDGFLSVKYPEVVFIKNENKGFGQGNNVGANIAKGKYLFFLNPDTFLIEPVINYAYKKMESNTDFGMLGFQLVSETGNKNMSFYFLKGGGFLKSLMIKFFNYTGLYFEKIMFISGANMFMSKENFINCGMFDENIFMYYEEPDLTFRLHELGKMNYFCRTKKIVHLEAGCPQDFVAALERRLDSARYYNKKYHMSFSTQLKKELRLNKAKVFIARFFYKNKVNSLVLQGDVLKKYLLSVDE